MTNHFSDFFVQREKEEDIVDYEKTKIKINFRAKQPTPTGPKKNCMTFSVIKATNINPHKRPQCLDDATTLNDRSLF